MISIRGSQLLSKVWREITILVNVLVRAGGGGGGGGVRVWGWGGGGSVRGTT